MSVETVTLSPAAKVTVADALSLGIAALLVVKVAVYVPAVGELPELKLAVVEPLAPGLSVREELPNATLHPLGAFAARLKLAAEQLGLSLLLTVNL